MSIDRRKVMMGGLATAVTASLAGCVAGSSAVSSHQSPGPFQSQQIIAATNRAAWTSAERTQDIQFFAVDVSVPLDREPGLVPARGANAFSIAAQRPLSTPNALSEALLASGRAGVRAPSTPLILWVHGYNNTSSEAVFRQAQMAVDAEISGPQVAYLWPSAGTLGGYLHDRDSVLHARQPLSDLIDTLTQVWPGDLVIVAHSLGGFLTMETLVRRARAGKPLRRDLAGVVLLQPDIGLDVFTAQMGEIGPRPDFMAVVAVAQDRVLHLSARLSQSEARVGAHTDLDFYQGLGIQLIDASKVDDAHQLHLVAFSSPSFLSLIGRESRREQS